MNIHGIKIDYKRNVFNKKKYGKYEDGLSSDFILKFVCIVHFVHI